MRALLHNETVTFDGDYVHLDGVELDYVYQERRPKDVPIYIGATGMQMMELTGEIADGVVLNYLVSPDYNARAMEHLAIGAERAGRQRRRHRPPAARRVPRPRGPPDRARHGPPDGHPVPRPAAAHHEGARRAGSRCSTTSARCSRGRPRTSRSRRPSKLVPDEIVQMLTATGTADEARAKVAEYVAAGCTCPILYPLGDVHAMIDAFAGAP